MNPELEAAREALIALPDEAAHALDPEAGPAPADLPPGVPPPPPFTLPEHLGQAPWEVLRAAQAEALAAGLSETEANAAAWEASQYVREHGTAPAVVHARELQRGTDAGLPPDEVARLAREAGDRAAAAREAARAPQTPGSAPAFPGVSPAGADESARTPYLDPAPPPVPAGPPAAALSPRELKDLERLAGGRGEGAALLRRLQEQGAVTGPELPALPPAEPTPETAREAPPFDTPLPDVPAPFLALPADIAGPAAGVFGLEVPSVLGPADVTAPGAPPVPVPDAARQGPGGGTPPWWDPLLGAVVGAEPEPTTPPWWDPFLGEAVEPGTATGRPPAPPAPGAGQLAEAAALAREAEGAPEAEEEARAEGPPGPSDAPRGETRRGVRDSPFGGNPFSYAGRVLGRGLDELLGPGGDYGPPAPGGVEGAAGGGMMEVLVRIAEGVERLIEVVEGMGDGGGNPGGPGYVGSQQDYGYGDEDETPASPSVDLAGLPQPGKTRDAYGHPRPQSPKRQSPAGEH